MVCVYTLPNVWLNECRIQTLKFSTFIKVHQMAKNSEVGLTLSTIGMLIVAARRSIRQLIAAKVVPLDITPHHYWMLMTLLKGAPMSLGELTRAMWMDNPTVSRMVQQMEFRGYLTVSPDPTHGRKIQIRLTEEGYSLCEQLSRIGADFQEYAQQCPAGWRA